MKDGNRLFHSWRIFNRPGASATHTPQTPLPPVLPTKPDKTLGKILLVDDDLIIQRTVMQAVEKRGYQVLTASDISVALSLVRQEKPDLILLDLTFPLNAVDVVGPLHNGFFMIEWLRHAVGAKTLPVIIISGTDPAEYKTQISVAGIFACFRKPLDHSELLASIDSALGKGRWSSRA
jgi:DNA-binding response OmpR family regulator